MTSTSGPLPGCPRILVTPLRMTQCWDTTGRDLRVLLLGVWGTPGEAGEGASGDCTTPIMGCLGEEPQAGKGLDVGDLGRSKSGKTGARGWKGLGTCEQAAGGDVLVWLCPVPAQHRLSCFLLRSFQIFVVWALFYICSFRKMIKSCPWTKKGKQIRFLPNIRAFNILPFFGRRHLWCELLGLWNGTFPCNLGIWRKKSHPTEM